MDYQYKHINTIYESGMMALEVSDSEELINEYLNMFMNLVSHSGKTSRYKDWSIICINSLIVVKLKRGVAKPIFIIWTPGIK